MHQIVFQEALKVEQTICVKRMGREISASERARLGMSVRCSFWRATRCCADALKGLAHIEYESEVFSVPRRTRRMPGIVFKAKQSKGNVACQNGTP